MDHLHYTVDFNLGKDAFAEAGKYAEQQFVECQSFVLNVLNADLL